MDGAGAPRARRCILTSDGTGNACWRQRGEKGKQHNTNTQHSMASTRGHGYIHTHALIHF